jgi:hypothetical protein
MRYPDGQEIRLGDRMKLWDGSEAIVVCSIDTREYSRDFPGEHWEYLARGIVISTAKLGCSLRRDRRGNAAAGEGQDMILAE